MLEYADQLTQTPVEVDETLFESLRANFNAAQLVELTATIAWENYRARFNHAFGAESENFPRAQIAQYLPVSRRHRLGPRYRLAICELSARPGLASRFLPRSA